MNIMISLLKNMQVTTIFWGEAIRHEVYLLNRLIKKALDTHTYEHTYEHADDETYHLKSSSLRWLSSLVKLDV